MALELSHLNRRFTGFAALNDVSLSIAPGEFVALLGPSGSGKTTLLRILAGLDYPDSGSVEKDGEDFLATPARERRIGMVFQHYALFRHLTVVENIAFGLRVRPWRSRPSRRDIRERVDRLLLRVQLEGLGGRYPTQLSGGQRQRVALGRALVRDPKVFLLDEPLSNLDAKLRLSMRVEIARIHQRLKATMVYVTHDQIEAMTLGQRIVVLNGGVIQQIDTPMNLYDKPANLFVAGFLGSPAMNLLRGTLQLDGGWKLVLPQGVLSLGALPQAAALDAWRDREVVMGVRPEDLLPHASADTASLSAELEVVEPVGNEIFLNLRHGGQALVSRTPPRELPAAGSTLHFALVPERLHFFDAEKGQRIG